MIFHFFVIINAIKEALKFRWGKQLLVVSLFSFRSYVVLLFLYTRIGDTFCGDYNQQTKSAMYCSRKSARRLTYW